MNVRIPRFTALAIRAALLALLPLSAFAGSARIESGHSAMWIDPSRNGEGWIVEILPNDTAALYWYTSDDEGQPRWIISHAPIVHGEDGDKIIYNELITGHGGHFGPDYDPDEVFLETVGNAELSFSDCNTGQIAFNAYGKTGTYPLTRLTRTMAAGCAPVHGIPGEPVQPYAGTSGTWYDPDKTGQAFTLQWLADGAPILFWFAYDTEGNPFWMAGLGQYEEGRIVFPQLDSVQGGQFGEQYPPEEATLVPWGRLELELTCDSGTATYEATAEGFGSGSFNIVPLTRLAKPACPWVKPKLTDLYDLEYAQLPAPSSPNPPFPGYIFAKAISDDGTVIGTSVKQNRGENVVILRPGATQWEWLSEDDDYDHWMLHLASDKTIFALKWLRDEAGYLAGITVKRWREGGDWQYLENTREGHSQVVYGISKNGLHLTGEAYLPNSPASYLWRWSAGIGDIDLPVTDEFLGSIGFSVSNDGNTTVGWAHRMIEGVPYPVPFAVMWRNGGMPERLLGPEGQELGRAIKCNADCSIVFGADWHEFWRSPPESYTPWYFKPSGGFGYLGVLPDDAIPELGASIHEVSMDGGIVVGDYTRMLAPLNPNVPNRFATDAFIWMQDIGMVSIGKVLIENFGIDYHSGFRYATSVSPNGRLVLLTESYIPSDSTSPIHRAAVLRLKPKAPPGVYSQP